MGLAGPGGVRAARVRGLAVPPGGTTGLPGRSWADGAAPAPTPGALGGNGARPGPTGEAAVLLSGALGPLASPFASEGMGLTGVAGTAGGAATDRLVGRRPLSPRGAGIWGDRPCAAPFSSPALGIEAPGALGGADAAGAGRAPGGAAAVFGPDPAGGFSGGRNSRTGGRSGVPLPAILSEGREMASGRGLTPAGLELAGVAVERPLDEGLTVSAKRGAGGRSLFF